MRAAHSRTPLAEIAHELAEAVSSADAVPGSGWVAGVSAGLAAALIVKAASRSISSPPARFSAPATPAPIQR